MAYDAVYEYADEDSSTYNEYQLTYDPVLDGDDEIKTEIATYTKTTSEEWNQVSCEEDDGNGCTIDPIRCTVDEDFSVNISDEEVELLKDANGEICYEKVFQWCLPRFGEDGDDDDEDDDDDDESLSEFQAARQFINVCSVLWRRDMIFGYVIQRRRLTTD
jgi:hypothetical protein